MSQWQWDPTLYRGSAEFYTRGRVAYPVELTDAIAAELVLDGTGRLLDVGCGPGSLTVALAPLFAAVVGLDADPDMLAEGARVAALSGLTNVQWVHTRAEELDPALGDFDVITLAQSFHWMDRPTVARALRERLTPDGALVHVHATTHAGVDSPSALPHPRPPRQAIGELVERYLGSQRRAGQGILPDPPIAVEVVGRQEDAIYRGAGLTGPTRLEVPGRVVTRTADEVVASVFSPSGAAPHLFGGHVADFEADLRELLRQTSPDATFSEQLREIAVDVWRRHPRE